MGDAVISVCIGTYGNPWWANLALKRALPSARSQDCEVLIGHDEDGTRHGVRNGLAERATQPWLLFLDADDELFPDFIERMEFKIAALGGASRSLLTPAVSYLGAPDHTHHPRLLPTIDIDKGNCLILGTLIERSLFFEVGGFHDWNARDGNEYDDWDLWIRCLAAGAKIVRVPKAVYVAHLTDSPSRTTPRETTLRWQWEIGREHFPDIYDDGWIDRQLEEDMAL